MRKNISIDELFREGLSEGREQHNLGAWANMERLLEGKAPYTPGSDGEEKKKRRILPLFGLLLIALVGVMGTLFVRHKLNDKEKGSASVTKVEQSAATTESSTAVATPDATSSNGVSASTNSTDNSATSVPENTESSSSTSNHPIPTEDHANNPSRFTSTTYHDKTASNGKEKHSSNASSQNTELTSNTSSDLDIPSSRKNHGKKKHSDATATSTTPSSTDTHHKDSDNSVTTIATLPSGKTRVSDTVEQITRVERVTGTVLGKRETRLDTIDKSQQVITKEHPATPIDYHQSNPRYVDLDKEEDIQAAKNADIAVVPVLKAEPKTEKDVVKSNTKNSSNQHGKLKESLEDTRIKLGNTLNRISINKLLAYPGITAGVNAALFTASRNYGGFHAGVSNLTPINDHLAFLTEIRFFYRSNSGYSVQDIQSSMKGFTSDTSTLSNQHQTIYTYDMDSSVRRYNFKHMYSVEMPLSLQYNLNRLSFYGGVNLAYNSRLNTTLVTNNPTAHYYDTLDNSTTFLTPTSSNYKYVGDDFKSRFGIGYMLGTSYAFSPNVYIDLRATQTQWDNSKTVTSRAVSSSVFKIPYIQFSLGYRFKKYTPGGN